MKLNSQKLLVALYPTSQQFPQVDLEILKVLLPDLTEDGQRSLIYLLEQKRLLSVSRFIDGTMLSLTRQGKDTLEALFPALNPRVREWNGEWNCVVFQRAPKTDPQFRYLRTFIRSQRGISLSRGTYLVPSVFSEQVLRQCQDFYHDSVAIFQRGDWALGSGRPIAMREYGLLDIINTYSGVSREIPELLSKTEGKKELTYTQKVSLHNTYTRFVETLLVDSGLVEYYFPGREGGLATLTHFQQLLKL